ncbi:MAG: cell division protein [Methyloprofundus sp.]|nr:cell division protein [Methyloprofundus sp.]
MDKELLRIVIIAVGAVLILGMILWSILSSRSKGRKIDFYDKKDPLENIDPSLVVNTDDDDFDIVPLKTRENDEFKVTTRINPEYIAEVEEELSLKTGDDDFDLTDMPELIEEEDKPSLPALIQLSLVAEAEQGFSGPDLFKACSDVGLVFGNVKVFERLDSQNQVEYAVANMVNPGIFPDDFSNYQCAGITFFLQPREVDNAPVVFAEMIETIGKLAQSLIGNVLDEERNYLTQTTLDKIEASLL